MNGGSRLAVSSNALGYSFWDAADLSTGFGYVLSPEWQMYDGDISSDGRLMALSTVSRLSGRGRLALYDIQTGQELQELAAHEKLVRVLRFSPDGRTLATGGDDLRLILWDVAAGRPYACGELREHRAPLAALAFSRDGRVMASGGFDRLVKLWDIPANLQGQSNTLISTHTFRGFGTTIADLCFSPDGTLLIIGSEQAEVMDLASRERRFTLAGRNCAFSPDGKTFAVAGGSLKNEARVYDAASGQEIARLQGGHEKDIRAVRYSPDGARVLTGSADGRLRAWDPITGAEIIP